MGLLLAEEFHDIAPPVDYSLVPAWLIFCGALGLLALLGLIGWRISRRPRKPKPAQSPRARALARLERMGSEVESAHPYQFSIGVSDLLRSYVHEQFQVPSTRQTSVEFLSAVAHAPAFSTEERALLREFLDRCDLIKFARYEATSADSKRLLEEAMRFVQGGKVEPV